MSYIHEALKKAQKDKDTLAGKFGSIWSNRYGRRVIIRERLVSACIILVAVGFSAYTWLHSVGQLSSGHEKKLAVSQSATKPPDLLGPHTPRVLPSDEDSLNSQGSQVRKKPTNRVLPARKRVIKEAEKPPLALRKDLRHDNSTTLYSQALALQKEGRLQEARKLYEAALQRSPRLVSALNNLGAIYIKEKNIAAARRVFEKAIRIDANYVDPYYNLACLHALQNDVGRSLFYLKKAVSVDEAARKWAETDEDLLNLRGHIQYEKIVKGAQKS